VTAADEALAYHRKAIELVEAELKAEPAKPAMLDELAHCYTNYSGLSLWKWELTRTEEDLKTAIELLEAAVQHCERAAARSESFAVGRLAQTHLKLLLLLRMRDRDRDRPDRERHRDAILALRTKPTQNLQTVSYLRWFQAIALADAGDADGSHRLALSAFLEDAKSMGRPDSADIGRRQYSSLRRFLEQYSNSLRNPSLIGRVSQVLQVGHHTSGQLLENHTAAGTHPA
jgi:hypothetical protein